MVRYLATGSASGSVAVNRADRYSQGSHGARPKTTIESQQMDPAGKETGSTGMQHIPGASVPSSGPMEVGHVMPGDLRQPCPPSESHIVHPLGWMCSQLVLRHRVLSHEQTKWWATSGYVTLAVSLACLDPTYS